MRARIGDAADWCTFAMWASRQAGSTIRGEDLLDDSTGGSGGRSGCGAAASLGRMLLRRGLFQPETAWAAWSPPSTPRSMRSSARARSGERQPESLRGNRTGVRAVLAMVPVDATRIPGVRRVCGRPPSGRAARRAGPAAGRVRPLSAAASRNRSRRARRWILLANLKIGFHEQTRLQPQIVAAVTRRSPPRRSWGARAAHACFPAHATGRVFSMVLPRSRGRTALVVRREAVRVTREVVTEAMMVLACPARCCRSAATSTCPSRNVLAGATHAVPRRLRAGVRPVPARRHRVRRARLVDLQQRLHYITHLFRAYAEAASIFWRPFTEEQVAASA